MSGKLSLKELADEYKDGYDYNAGGTHEEYNSAEYNFEAGDDYSTPQNYAKDDMPEYNDDDDMDEPWTEALKDFPDLEEEKLEIEWD